MGTPDDCGCDGKDQVARAAGQSPMDLRRALQALHGGGRLTSTAEAWLTLRRDLVAVDPTPYHRLAEEVARLDTLYGVTP